MNVVLEVGPERTSIKMSILDIRCRAGKQVLEEVCKYVYDCLVGWETRYVWVQCLPVSKLGPQMELEPDEESKSALQRIVRQISSTHHSALYQFPSSAAS